MTSLDKISEKAEEIGVLKERNRIMTEIEEGNFPLGVWTLIKEIICPPK